MYYIYAYQNIVCLCPSSTLYESFLIPIMIYFYGFRMCNLIPDIIILLLIFTHQIYKNFSSFLSMHLFSLFKMGIFSCLLVSVPYINRFYLVTNVNHKVSYFIVYFPYISPQLMCIIFT